MKTPQIPPLKGMSPLGVKPAPELFEAPFNLIGETWNADLTAEGEARVRALAEAEARKAQMQFQIPFDPHKRRPSEHGVY